MVLDQCKRDFIIPALKNFSLNSGLEVSPAQDVTYLIANLVDEARSSYLNEMENQDTNTNSRNTSMSEGAVEFSPNLSASTSPSSPNNISNKRKITNNEDSIKRNAIDFDYLSKSAEKSSSKKVNPSSKKSKTSNLETNSFNLKFNSETKFVLGKNVNELFFQQLSNENANTNETHKSIYSKYPKLFKYEADTNDRQWLTENSIIKRKNIKCFILIFSEIEELFSNLKFENNDAFIEANSNASPTSKLFESNAVLSKNLKTFNLPDTILYKLNRQYFYRK